MPAKSLGGIQLSPAQRMPSTFATVLPNPRAFSQYRRRTSARTAAPAMAMARTRAWSRTVRTSSWYGISCVPFPLPALPRVVHEGVPLPVPVASERTPAFMGIAGFAR